MAHDLEVYQQYQHLVARVEAFGEAVRQQYPGQVTCHAGCDGCCYQHFTVFPIEAYHLAQAVRTLEPGARQLLLERLQAAPNPWRQVDEPQPCVLLDRGRCMLYAGRPLICRLHGFPLYSTMIERSDGIQRDCCPLNFTQVPLAEIAPQAIVNLDLVNQTLVALNHLFVQARQQSDQRETLRHAVLAALTDTTLGNAAS